MTKTPFKRLEDGNTKSSTCQKARGRPRKQVIEINSDSDDEVTFVSSSQRTPIKHKSSERDTNNCVTPPKQRKNTNSDAGIPQTPSTLFRKLHLNSPTKRRQTSSPYQNARKALHSTVPTQMPGREKELDDIRDFVGDHLTNSASTSLYISGPPGTGKTAALSLILKEEKFARFKKILVNCTTIKSSAAIYTRISNELNIKANAKNTKEHLAAIENYLSKNRKMIIMVLDEIDQLDSKNQSVLYTIFEWPAKPKSKLILIGIANALDLTDRILPRLQAHCNLKPTLMHFAPYSKQQLEQIFVERLTTDDVVNVFSPIAIKLLAGKVAAVSGDVRRALDIGRRVVELAEQNRSKEVLQSVENLLSEEQKSSKIETVDLKHVVSVLNSVYGTSQNLDDTEDAFPLQQKIIICTILLILKKAKNKDITIGKLHDVYKKVCQKRNISVVDQAEFVGLCSLVETRGIIRVISKKEPRLHKINLEWNEDEVVEALRDKQLTSSILQDSKCLEN